MKAIFHILQTAPYKLYGAVLFCTLLTGCLNYQTYSAYESFKSLSHDVYWEAELVETSHFSIKSARPRQAYKQEDDTLFIYIEGDGTSWLNRMSISPDPTPKKPLILRLASQDTYHKTAYLARPCQYVLAEGAGVNCNYPLWTDGRFNKVILDNLSQAIDQIKKDMHAKDTVLIGFSGGGSIAMLLAAQRNDVIGIVTIAGLFNHESWTAFHKVSGLGQSLNPVDVFQQIAKIPQYHLLGENDKRIPNHLSIKEIKKLQNAGQGNIIFQTFPNVDHTCCWENIWPRVLPKLNGYLQYRP